MFSGTPARIDRAAMTPASLSGERATVASYASPIRAIPTPGASSS